MSNLSIENILYFMLINQKINLRRFFLFFDISSKKGYFKILKHRYIIDNEKILKQSMIENKKGNNEKII